MLSISPCPLGRGTVAQVMSVAFDAPAFRPERFLGSSANAYSLLSFGGGAHRCIGASLAQLEMKIVLREILARLHLAPVSETLARPVPRGPTLAPRGGARVRIVGHV